jgi:hypothetical protein
VRKDHGRPKLLGTATGSNVGTPFSSLLREVAFDLSLK